jgi:hypothetical protein
VLSPDRQTPDARSSVCVPQGRRHFGEDDLGRESNLALERNGLAIVGSASTSRSICDIGSHSIQLCWTDRCPNHLKTLARVPKYGQAAKGYEWIRRDHRGSPVEALGFKMSGARMARKVHPSQASRSHISKSPSSNGNVAPPVNRFGRGFGLPLSNSLQGRPVP